MGAPTPEDLRYRFSALGMQYYAAGRSAILKKIFPVAGNLFHHSAEMLLKAGLSSTLDLRGLKRIGHCLPDLWEAFHQQGALTAPAALHDVLQELERFEDLRYPDSVLAQGALMEFALLKEHVGTIQAPPSSTPRYTLVLEAVDELHVYIVETAGLGLLQMAMSLSQEGRLDLYEKNTLAERWRLVA